ncbi:MAG: Lrp/AsnC ligand binding domain-containing protein [Chloroflexota bacterium]|nr:MAG: Lrp/AsnC ligand binding domain-containing protein [Chloroflexota bacterium]
MKAFIMIDIRTGEIPEVVRQLQQVEAVTEAYITFGPYDAVAVVSANDISHLGRIMSTIIQPIPGVLDTLTCIAVDE